MYRKLIAQKSKLGFMPLDEPLLKHGFKEKKYRIEIKKNNKKIIIPSPSLLLAMKINSLKGREKEHKKIKDICDITVLCLYSGTDIEQLKKELIYFLSKNKIKKSLDTVNANDIEEVVKILDIEKPIMAGLIEKLKN